MVWEIRYSKSSRMVLSAICIQEHQQSHGLPFCCSRHAWLCILPQQHSRLSDVPVSSLSKQQLET